MMERAVQQLSASCSYSTPSLLPRRLCHPRRNGAVVQPNPKPSCGAKLQLFSTSSQFARRPSASCAAVEREAIQGYTPAQFISWTGGDEHRCHHMVAVEVAAPARVCYALWDDWSRMVDYLDLVTQIGLDPKEPDLGLFQCFYRWGRLPIMEIVFLAKKVQAEQGKLLRYESIWGMPAAAEVAFIEGDAGSHTTVIFKLEHQLPHLLVDLKIGVFGVETHLRTILSENMAAFKTVAEAEAKNPTSTSTSSKQAAAGSSKGGRTEKSAGSSGKSAGNGVASSPAAPAPAQAKAAGGPRRSKSPDAPAATPKKAAVPAAPVQQQQGGSPGQAGKRGRARSTTPAAS